VLDPKVIAERKLAAKALRAGAKAPRRAPAVAAAGKAVVGEEYVQLLQEHLSRLREAYRHPNRVLHYDQVLVALLLGFFNAADNSLRMIDDLSCCEDSAPMLDGTRVCRSTLSDAMASMEADRLLPVIKSLTARLPALRRADPDLHALLRTIVAADGSVFTVPADVLWGIALTRSNGKVGRQIRLDLQLDVLRFVPTDVSVSGAEGGNEADAFEKRLASGVVYVADRNFVDFDFIRAALARDNDLVVRLKKDTTFVVTRERELTQEDRDAGVLRDRDGHLSDAFGDDTRVFREVVVLDPRSGKEVRFLTTLLEPPAKVIGKLYRHRWMIELFFKWLKCVARLRHLVSHSQNGVTIQFYVAVIMVLLTYLRTGHKPGVYEFNCLSWVAAGMMSPAAMQQVLARRQRERDLARARLAKKSAAAAQQRS
jgi:hypothetical protein